VTAVRDMPAEPAPEGGAGTPATCEAHDRPDCAACARAAAGIYFPDVVVSGNGIDAPWDYGPGTGGSANWIGIG
jgi:hypothetical protein